MDIERLRKDYIQLITNVREHVEQQLQLGFTETEQGEPEQDSPYANFDLPALTADAESCTKCPLHETRNSVVFAVGDPNADLMFIGEAPGADEDRQGEPFVGRAGQLLTQIIESGMKLKREDVYIANVIKCRPPGNRNPEPNEVETCSPYLMRQIELVQPKVIVALGSFAAKMMLDTKTGITKLRGEFHPCNVAGLRVLPHKTPPVVMPTYHPAYLLRNPNAKRDVWEDVKKVLAFLEQA
jgi:DNA polymerase